MAIFDWLNNTAGVAAWISGLFTFLAVCAALWAARIQSAHAISAERERRKKAEALTLLALQLLASELRRMCRLVGFQIDQEGNPTIYPDIPGEFMEIGKMIGQLPIDHIASLGRISDVLHLRRVASDMAILFKNDPRPGSGFYLSNRKQITSQEAQAGLCSRALADELKSFSPQIYADHAHEITRL